MGSVAENIARVRGGLPAGVGLTAVSKFHPVEKLMEAYEAGQRVFGESRVQELLTKVAAMPEDVEWHFIGHLQTNKVRQLVGKVSMIESVDSVRLLGLIDAESVRAGVESRVLMQVHVAREETKFGFDCDELLDFFRSGGHRGLAATRICGVMGMASNTDDAERVSADFGRIAEVFSSVRSLCGDELPDFRELSMGMSHDYPEAVRRGSTMVRVGSAIFGDREY